jgi:hypothetical protein
MANRNAVFADHHVLDQQPDDLLTVPDIERLGLGPHVRKEVSERVGQSQVRRLVGEVGVQRLKFCLQVLLAPAQLRHSMAQFVKAQQVLLIGREQSLHSFLELSHIARQLFLVITLCRVRVARRVKAPLELRLDDRGVLQQTHDL